MFDAAKALLLSHDFVSKKHDTILTQFRKTLFVMMILVKIFTSIMLKPKNLEENQVMISL